ncbi:hypothetical protein K2V56_09250 [Staphylococcus chromogenes]|uniref:DoxX family protein n=1 Tax=Staphylococcus chromogenes TaxID=46126 RepID=UPI000D02E263|nr:hypothetical protein [Staphylococcus chromogenes]MCD8905668.1 hypothetical protein [Staphylococcus chromogenes]UXS68510.1 hypothetical protein MUA19_03525 [Staphylococcus chromogenes]
MKTVQRYMMGIPFIIVGLLHFVHEGKFRKIVPHYLPLRKEAVLITGVCELIIGFGLLLRKPGYLFKHAIIAFLWAVFPANIYMARRIDDIEGMNVPKPLLYARLPLQFLLMKWIRHL